MRHEVRERLIETATEMMRVRGYPSVGVTEVAKATGISRAHFYRTFGAKHDRGVAVVEAYAAERAALLNRAFREEMPVRGQIQRMFSMLHSEQRSARAALGQAPGSLFTMFRDDVGEAEVALRAAVNTALIACRDRLAGVLRQAVRAGEVQIPNPDYPAEAIIAFAEGVLQMARATDDPDVVMRMAPASMSLLVNQRATGAWPLILQSSGSFPAVR